MGLGNELTNEKGVAILDAAMLSGGCGDRDGSEWAGKRAIRAGEPAHTHTGGEVSCRNGSGDGNGGSRRGGGRNGGGFHNQRLKFG